MDLQGIVGGLCAGMAWVSCGVMAAADEPVEVGPGGGVLGIAAAERAGQVEVDSDHGGYTGEGFANFTTDDASASLTWRARVEQAGTYELLFRYALSEGNRPLRVRVNGEVVEQALDFPATGGWGSWQEVGTMVALDEGVNEIALEQIEMRGANIDRLVIADPDAGDAPGAIYWDRDEGIEIPDYELPDALTSEDGQRIETPEQWKRIRRPEVLELFREHVYGYSPGLPDGLRFEVVEEDEQAFDGAATDRRVAVHSRVEDREHTFTFQVLVPNDVDEPAPVILFLTREFMEPGSRRSALAEVAFERGYGVAAVRHDDTSPDSSSRYTEGLIELFEGDASDREPNAWRALAAWGWAGSRAMDYLETYERVDAERVGIVGHSRRGKASLWAGAEDERFALVGSMQSGSGGAALSRRPVGQTVDDIIGPGRFRHWFAENFQNFAHREDELPVDQHMLIGLIAPRPVYVGSADDDLWADPRGEYQSLAYASDVYGLWGYERMDPDGMPPLDRPVQAGPRGYHVRSGGHAFSVMDMNALLDFADEQWR